MKRMTAVLLTLMLLCGMTAARAAEPDSYMATGGAIADLQTYPGAWAQTYQQILNSHSARIRMYQERTLEYYLDYVLTQIFIPCKPVSIVDLTSDGIPELIFVEAVSEERADLYVYSSNGASAACALYVPGIARLGANDVDMGYRIYLSANAGGTLMIEYLEWDTPWRLQLAWNGVNRYNLLNWFTEDYDPSRENEADNTFYHNGAPIDMYDYDEMLHAIRTAKTLAVTDYIAEDKSRYGLTLTLEEALAELQRSGGAVTGPAANTGMKLYGLTIDRLATRKGPGTQYDGGGTYNVKGQYIEVLARAYDKRNGIWWVKCVIPYKGENRILWTGYKRFDHEQLPLESIPIESGW